MEIKKTIKKKEKLIFNIFYLILFILLLSTFFYNDNFRKIEVLNFLVITIVIFNAVTIYDSFKATNNLSYIDELKGVLLNKYLILIKILILIYLYVNESLIFSFTYLIAIIFFVAILIYSKRKLYNNSSKNSKYIAVSFYLIAVILIVKWGFTIFF